MTRQACVVDVGHQFGLGCGRVFDSWAPKLIRPRGIDSFESVAKEADLVVFGGGSDIHVSLYGHRNVASHCGDSPSTRDIVEKQIWAICQKNKTPIFGICRGAQLACALSGGALVQSVTGHAGSDHPIFFADGSSLMMSTAHHQMMFPDNVPHELIAWTKNISRGKLAYDSNKFEPKAGWCEKEPEIVYFPETNAIAVQGHPEFMGTEEPAVDYVKALIIEKFFKGNKEIHFGGK